MKKSTVILFATLLTGVMQAQTLVPGYMGRRLSAAYSTDLMFAVSPTAASHDGGLNHSHNFDLEYSIRNRTNLCIGLHHFRTGISTPSGFDYQAHRPTYIPSGKEPMTLRSNGIELGFRFFQKGQFAPIGKYRKPGIVLYFNKTEYDRNAFRYIDDNGKQASLTIGSGEVKSMDFGIFYELGRQRVLADRVVLNGGVRFGFTGKAFFGNFFSFLFDSYSYSEFTSFESVLSDRVEERTFTHELVNVHIGIAFLAY